MTDDIQQNEHRASRRFIKGVHRAFFSPVEPEDVVVTPSAAPIAPVPPVQPMPQPQPIVTPVPVQPQPVAAPPTVKLKRKKSPAKFIFFMLLGLVIAGVGGYSFYMYWNSQQQLSRLQTASPQAFVTLENEALVKRVARHMELPNETPLITTVANAESLKNQVFFAHAKDGDKVLVFSQRAILYDPVADKIIEVGAIRPVTPTPLASETATNSAIPQVAGAATQSGRVLINNDK